MDMPDLSRAESATTLSPTRSSRRLTSRGLPVAAVPTCVRDCGGGPLLAHCVATDVAQRPSQRAWTAVGALIFAAHWYRYQMPIPFIRNLALTTQQMRRILIESH